jgi:plastocyanin
MRRFAVLLAAGASVVLMPLLAAAAVHDVSVGNYWFEDDATGSRDNIVVNEGDQVRFTIRQAAYPPHDIVIPAYGIDSPQLQLFQTYTTPPLTKPGTFLVYCRAHKARGHETTLVVKAKATAAPAPGPTQPGSGGAPPPPATGNKATPKASTTPSPGATGTPSPTPVATGSTAPSGVGEASDRRAAPSDPDSLEGILGRRFGGGVAWTAALWQAAILALPIGAAAGFAIRRERRRWNA